MCRGRRHPPWRAVWRTSLRGRARRPLRRPACWRPTSTRSAPCCTRALCSRSRRQSSVLLALTSPWSSCWTKKARRPYSLLRTNYRRILIVCSPSTSYGCKGHCRSSMYQNGTKTHQPLARASSSASVCLTRRRQRQDGAVSTRRLRHLAASGALMRSHHRRSCPPTRPVSDDGLLADLTLIRLHPVHRHVAASAVRVRCARHLPVRHSALANHTSAGGVRND